MGANNSALETFTENPVVRTLCGITSIAASPADIQRAVWLQLRSAPLVIDVDRLTWRTSITPFCMQLRTNNPGTHNLNALLFVTTDMLANFVPHQDSVSTLTAVMLLKIFLQYWVECSGAPQPSPAAEATYQQQAATPESAQQLRTLLDLPAESEFWKTVVTFRERDGHGGQSSLQEMAKQSLSAALFHASIQFLSSVSVNPQTAQLHEQILELVLVMLSTQVTVPDTKSEADHLWWNMLFHPPATISLPAAELVSALLINLVLGRADSSGQGVYSMMKSYASNILWYPWKRYVAPFLKRNNGPDGGGSSQLAAGGGSSPVNTSPMEALANLSLLVLIVLAHYQPSTGTNQFRTILGSFVDTAAVGAADDVETGGQPSGTTTASTPSSLITQVPFRPVYEAILSRINEPGSGLLLLYLLQTNPAFLASVIARADLDGLVIPLLAELHRNSPQITKQKSPGNDGAAPSIDPSDSSISQLYVTLVTILVLTSDSQFSSQASSIIIPDVRFIKFSHPLKNISLDQLTALVLLQTIFNNKRTLRDSQIASNCLACLANLAAGFEKIHPHLAQALIKLLQVSSRSYLKAIATAPAPSSFGDGIIPPAPEGSLQTTNPPSTSGLSDHQLDEEDSDYRIQSSLYQLRLAIEVVAACLGRKLHTNSVLIYALVHDQDIFLPFVQHPELGPLLPPILSILSFFTKVIEDTNEPSLDPQRVLSIIGDNMLRFTSSSAASPRPFPQPQQYAYEEGDHHVQNDFFTPHVWKIVLEYPSIYYPPHTVRAFPMRSLPM